MNVTKWQYNIQFEILTLTVQKLHHWLWKWPWGFGGYGYKTTKNHEQDLLKFTIEL